MAKRQMPVKNGPVIEIVKEGPMNKDQYPEIPSFVKEITSNEPIKLVVANCENLNVRDKPTRESKVLFKIKIGTIVILDELVGDWMRIHLFDNKTKNGYILGLYTKEA